MIRYVASGQGDCSGRMLNKMQHKFSTYLCIVIQQVHLHNMVRIKGRNTREIINTHDPDNIEQNMHQPNTYKMTSKLRQFTLISKICSFIAS